MRIAGDGPAGGSSGRRQRPASAEQPGRDSNGGASLFTPAYRVSHGPANALGDIGYPAPEPGGTAPYQRGSAEQDHPAWEDSPAVPGYSWSTDDEADPWSVGGLSGYGLGGPSGRNAVRGFPPGPDDPLPVYSGPFTAWNRAAGGAAPPVQRPDLNGAARGADPARQVAAATITPDDFDTDFSLPAIKDPARTSSSRPKDLARRKEPGPSAGSRSADRGRTATATRRAGSAAASRTAVRAEPDGRDHRHRTPGHGGRAGSRQAGGARPRRGRPARRSGRLAVVVAIVVAAVIVGAGAYILLKSSPGHPSAGRAPGATHPPSGNTASPAPPGRWEYIGQRSTDPVPLTTAELFPKAFTSGVTPFRRSIAGKAHSCRNAVIGATLQSALHKAGCTQAIRASYWSRSAKLMATIGVFNLKTAAGAAVAASSAGRSAFVALLPAKSGPTHMIGQGTGIEEAVVKGHYLVLVYAESVKLTAPKTSAQRHRLKEFMKALVAQATIPLSERMVTGKPIAGLAANP
jgi:hypothetical protein